MAVAANIEQQMIAAGLVPILEVAFRHGEWWALPQEISAALYPYYASGQNAGYTWDWGEGGRAGAFAPNGARTQISRYRIDWAAGEQTNMDNQRKRSVRFIWVRPQDVLANSTGELPAAIM